jgi:hypothetical protein
MKLIERNEEIDLNVFITYVGDNENFGTHRSETSSCRGECLCPAERCCRWVAGKSLWIGYCKHRVLSWSQYYENRGSLTRNDSKRRRSLNLKHFRGSKNVRRSSTKIVWEQQQLSLIYSVEIEKDALKAATTASRLLSTIVQALDVMVIPTAAQLLSQINIVIVQNIGQCSRGIASNRWECANFCRRMQRAERYGDPENAYIFWSQQ